MRFAYLCVLVCAVEGWSVESTGCRTLQSSGRLYGAKQTKKKT